LAAVAGNDGVAGFSNTGPQVDLAAPGVAMRSTYLQPTGIDSLGLRAPGYNRRADLVCFVNGLPLVFIELKAVYRNIRPGFGEKPRIDEMLTTLPEPCGIMIRPAARMQ